MPLPRRPGRFVGAHGPLPFLQGVRPRLLLLVLLAMLPPMGVALWSLERGAEAKLLVVEREMRDLARSLAREQASLVAEARTLLAVMGRLAAVQAAPRRGAGAGGDAARARCTYELQEIAKAVPWQRRLAVVDAAGFTLCSSIPTPPEVTIADRPHFQEAIGGGRFVVSGLITGRVVREPQFVAAAPVAPDARGGDGAGAVVLAVLDLAWIGRIGDGGGAAGRPDVMLLLDAEGQVALRRPALEGSDLRLRRGGPLAEAVRASGGQEGVWRGHGEDGVRRIHAFAPLAGTGATLVVGRDLDQVLAPLRRARLHSLLLLGGVALLAGLTAWWAGRAVLLRGIVGIAEAAERGGGGGDGAPGGDGMRAAAPDAWAAREVRQLHAALLGLEERRGAAEQRLREAVAKMEVLAATDPLTGLANRRHFDAGLQREWRRAAREGLPVSLLLLDADRFKQLNDHHGHPAGDACLRAIADILADSARRPGDMVARHGGEEFALLMPGTSEAGAMQQAEQIRAAIEAASIPHEANLPGRVATVSLGVATAFPAREDAEAGMPSPQAGRSPIDGFLSAADAALYAAKAAGRNRVRLARVLPRRRQAAFALPDEAEPG